MGTLDNVIYAADSGLGVSLTRGSFIQTIE